MSIASRLSSFGRRKSKVQKKPLNDVRYTEEKRDPAVENLKTHFEKLSSSGNLTRESFHLGKTLGTGTFGRVRLVTYNQPLEDGTFRRWVLALKMLRKTEIIRLKQVEHIKSEKNILSQCSHPFIVDMYGWFQDAEFVYMIMEFVLGGEVFSQLRQSGRFTNEASRFFAAEIVLAIESLHKQNIVYRDLKPENLLIDRHGHIKITDFGFAKKVEDRTWTLCGTPEYLAPEIIQSKGHGKAVDWWALGILIYEMLAGYPPFYDENPFGIYQKILAGRIEFPRHFEPHAKDLIRKLLTADRTKRYGCLKNAAEDVKQHKWFRSVNWDRTYNREVKPPMIPGFRSEDDTSNFDEYPDSDVDDDRPQLKPKHRELFEDF